MTRDEARAAIEAACQAISAAVAVIRPEMETIERFLGEDMDAPGAMFSLSIWSDSERRAVVLFLLPLFTATAEFIGKYNAHVAAGAAALDQVRERSS